MATRRSDVVESAFTEAARWFDDQAEAILHEQIRLCEILAPSGQEDARANYVADAFSAIGLRVQRSAVGNVLGRRPGRAANGGAIVVSAHLDTVFSAEQAVAVAGPGEPNPYRDGTPVPADEYHAPGISDAAAGLAALLALARALAVARIETDRELLFLATVGEEGRGDLRGARAFFETREGRQAAAFITIDHSDPNVIVHRGIGSRRYLVEWKGEGGHSWGHFGRYNPVFALASAAERLAQLHTPKQPRTTYNIGVVRGGESVNAIPESAAVEVDLRSEDAAQLDRLEHHFRSAVSWGHERELERRPTGALEPQLLQIGDRPAGTTPLDSTLVRATRAALQAEEFTPRLIGSSTDANAAIAAGVPAIALSWGGQSDNQHSLREWFSPVDRSRALRVLLRLMLSLAQ